MNKILPIVVISFLFSCSGEENQVSKKDTDTSVSDIIGIETLFNVDNFEDAKHLELLKELKICSEFQKDTSNYMEPACSPRFFRVFPMRDDAPVENAFLLQIKSKVGGIKLRRLVTFVREKGQLIKVNTFVANLIGTRTSKNHFKDLILRFNDNIEGEIIFYNCLFNWDGKKYTFKSVELIEGSDWRQRLKPEFKDSVSNDIYTTLVRNEMIL